MGMISKLFFFSLPLHLTCPVAPSWRIGPPHVLSIDSCLALQCAPLSQDCHPALDLSFSTVRRQVAFGRPLFLFPSGVHVRAVTQSLSGCCLRMCPMNCHLLLLTPSLNLSTLALSSSSLTLSCHLIFINFLRHRF